MEVEIQNRSRYLKRLVEHVKTNNPGKTAIERARKVISQIGR